MKPFSFYCTRYWKIARKLSGKNLENSITGNNDMVVGIRRMWKCQLLI